MKNILFITVFFLLVGCGVFDKKNINDQKLLTENEELNLNDTNGTYDLVEYLFPNKNQSNQYEIEIDRSDSDDSHKVNKIDEFTYIDDKHIALGDNITYSFDNSRINKKEFINGLKISETYRRFLNLKDVYYTYDLVNIQDSYEQIGKQVCNLAEYNKTREVLGTTYNNVIHLYCTGNFIEGNDGFNEKNEFGIDRFYAKNIGLIESVSQNINDTIHGIESFTVFTTTRKSIQKILE